MFRALVQGEYFIQHGEFMEEFQETIRARDLRSRIVLELKSNRDFIEPFLVEQPFEQYLRLMQQDHTWGGEPELAMAPACLKRPIVVYQKTSGNQAKFFMKYGEEQFGSTDPILVLFQGMHYDALVNEC
eukprot:TRINITY_DN14254_c0_g1_i3.p4 TRINITY_DN14254_c0_g1~~TRINITY_DN14254_c0_g1_i3.p4  ORF type:complete len:129 (-),score=11.33 TRINITY_DN14254_c0_g1_i3:369-755(-)